jgi:hypothetical protein
VKIVRRLIVGVVSAVALSGCTSLLDNPEPFAAPDEYVSGMRWFSRGEYKFAIKYWQPLADAGDCDAEFRIGTLYFLGAGVPRDYEAARQWWRKAGSRGQSFAQALLANMYAHDNMSVITIRTETWYDCTGGCGSPQNMVEAYRWMSLSEKCAVYPDTRKAANVTAKRYRESLTPEQIAEVDEFVKNWKAPGGACQPREVL